MFLQIAFSTVVSENWNFTMEKERKRKERKGDMSDLRLVIFLKFVRFGANFAQTVVLGYSLMNKS